MLGAGRSLATTLLAKHIEHAEAAGVTSTMAVLEDDPVERILTLADIDRVDAIVVGTHGRRGLRRLFVGSVAEQIVRRSTVPVAVVRA